MFRYSQQNRKLIDKDKKLLLINDYIKIKNPDLLSIMAKGYKFK